MKITCDIRLLSDTCLGGNDMASGVVDTEVVTDAWGIPYIPGKRIKGLFREMAMEAMEFGLVSESVVTEVFGKGGDKKETIYFQSLYPEGYEQLCDFLDIAKKDENWKEYADKKNVLEYYTTVRSQTALEESGIVKQNSLRKTRVAKRGIVFTGVVECPDDISKEKKDLLACCAKMIRHMGNNRTRGMGHVECKLTFDEVFVKDVRKAQLENAEKEYEKKDCYTSTEDEILPVRIRLNQPCVLEKDYIAGSMLRGIYASAYAKCTKEAQLQESLLFYDLFLDSKVKFGYCWPLKVTESEEKVYWPTPNSFVVKKKAEDGFIYDLAGTDVDSLAETIQEKERCKSSLIHVDEENVYHCSVDRKETYHHRRPEDRSFGRALKSVGATKTSNGQLYSKAFICEGQEFYGEIRGPKNLLEILKILIPADSDCYIGASRTAEYGKVCISYKAIKEETESVEVEDRTVITFLSPMVAMDEMGNDTTDVNAILHAILGDVLEDDVVVKCYCKEELVNGYNATWNMPLTQRNVLQPGSVIVIYGQELEEDEIERLNRQSYGLYQNEGFGRIFVNWHGDCEQLEDAGEYARLFRKIRVPDYKNCLNTPYQKYLDACLEQKVLQLCAQDSDTDFCYKVKRCLQKVPNSHVLSGLQQIYKTSVDFKMFGEQLKDAASRSKKRNSEWFDAVYDCFFQGQSSISNYNNAFYKQGNAKIDACGFGEGYRNKMKALLQANAYSYFSRVFRVIIYDVHLTLEKGGR